MPSWSKDKLFRLLEDRAYVFASWCSQDSKDSKAVSFFINNSETIDFTSDVWQNEIMPILIKQKVVDQAFVDRLNDFIGV